MTKLSASTVDTFPATVAGRMGLPRPMTTMFVLGCRYRWRASPTRGRVECEWRDEEQPPSCVAA